MFHLFFCSELSLDIQSYENNEILSENKTRSLLLLFHALPEREDGGLTIIDIQLDPMCCYI